MKLLFLTFFASLALFPSSVFSQTPETRPAPAIIPENFDEKEIFLASRPSLLPDGKHFVFEWCDNLWLVATEGGQAKLLQHSPGKDIWPIVSRDGSQIAFLSNRNGSYHLFTAPITENAQAKQVSFHSEGERPYQWSSDNTHVLCYAVRDDEGGYFNAGRPYWINVTDRSREKLVFDHNANEMQISPDNKQVLFTLEGEDLYRKGATGENVSQIWMFDFPSNTFSPLVKKKTESKTPLWTADGKAFYYISGEGDTQNLWLYSFENKTEKQITFFKGDSIIAPTISADGSTMVFRQGFYFYSLNLLDEKPEPKRIKIQAGVDASRSISTQRRSFSTVWNNDGEGHFAYTDKGLTFAFSAGGDLWVMDTVLKTPRLVYGDSRTHERDCVFSKDGSTLYFFSDRGDCVVLLKAVRSDENRYWWENTVFKVEPVLIDAKNRHTLKLSPDGKNLAWIEVENGSQIVLADLDGKEITRLPRAQSVSDFVWSPDSKWVAAAMSDEYDNSDIWLLSCSNEEPPYNISRHFSWDGAPRWSPDGKILIFLGQRPDTGLTLCYLWLNRDDEEALRTKDYDAALKKMGDKKTLNGINEKSKTNDVAKVDVAMTNIVASIEATTTNTVVATSTTNAVPAEIAKTNASDVAPVVITREDLHSRVRYVSGLGGCSRPYFSYDSRRVILAATINGKVGTFDIEIPNRLKPRFVTETWGRPIAWLSSAETGSNERLIWLTSDLMIAHYTEKFPFRVYQERDIADYQELGFLSAWGSLSSSYYDRKFHGADWEKIRHKYQYLARKAPSYSIFTRIMNMLNGELNSSHTGFYSSGTSKKEWDPDFDNQAWEPTTAHLGIRFDAFHCSDDGWKVRDVIPGGPADSTHADVKKGDIIVAIDDLPVNGKMDPTEILNRPAGRKFVLDVKRGTNDVHKVYITGTTYFAIRELLANEALEKNRKYVHKASNGRFGYTTISQMNDEEYFRFEREIFAEGFDKDGMIIDVRDNTGGFTADKILNILCVQRHSFTETRFGVPAYLASYWGRPVFDKPIVVLCNQNTVSNGEIFSHAIKQLKRGRLVGVQTNGGVIATRNYSLLDLGTLRHPLYGFYQLDGTDMEFNGAIPDIVVWNNPNDTVAGKDRQLDTAIQALQKDVQTWKEEVRPFVPKTVSWNFSL